MHVPTLQADLTGVGVFVTLLLYLITRRRDRRVRQAELLRSYTRDFYDSPETTSIFMAIDSEKFVLGDDDYGTDAELALIRFLDLLNTLGHNVKVGVISVEDILPTTIGYACLIAWNNGPVRSYLERIERMDHERGYPEGFRYLRWLAEKLSDCKPSRPATYSGY